MLTTHLTALPQEPRVHQHAHHQLVLSACGQGEIDLEGLQAPLDGLHACVVEGAASHAFFGEAGNRIIVVNLDTDHPNLNQPDHPDYDALSPLFERSRLLCLPPAVRSLADACRQTLQHTPNDPVLTRALGVGLLRACILSLDPGQAVRAARRFRLDLARIDAYIDAHLSGPICVADLAGSVCLSPGWFKQAFKSATGESPAAYVRRKRLERAHALILDTPWPLSRIAAECGFADQSALAHAFRRHFGCAPSHLRT
ncbi:MAG: AraC family transcriptional regulator [Gammaproteobacteria bacterium]|nr:MAG: AraC family transcriptional regulator [Gammaproteobacteria bacterium]